ncbi:OstA-like protein [Spirosoma sp. KUDC1026]|uniref:OstA-like protein n=1 Tax=Spirosoma sp. KUDC1026 TaxID=2745947 RepID=UPI00159B8651|nr:OstA-like protein [Spirosoma sp. KUDC1026]QKZ12013.1 hypothetical protein HU175_04970 [Spirosoma sp. KUDC1026]
MAACKRVLSSGLFIRFIFLVVGLLVVQAVRAQSGLNLPEQLTADVVDAKDLTQKLAGNVKLRHKGVVLFCDRAVHNVAAHAVRAYGHVLIVQGDSITARGDSAVFAYSDRHLLVYGRVMFQDHRTILTTTQLDYDLTAGVVTYTQKGRIVTDKNVLTSLKGTYNVQLKQFTCQQSVQLATRKGTVKSESLVYNTVTQRSTELPKVIYPTVTEQRLVKAIPAQQITEVTVVEPAAVAVTAPVTRPVTTSKPVSNTQPVVVPETKTNPALAAILERPTAVAEPAQSQPRVAISPEVYTASAPTFRQAVRTTPVRSTASSANAYTADLSDLERELNKKKRFH